MRYLHSFKLQFTIDGTGNKVLSVSHRELTIVDPRTKVILGRFLFREVPPKNVVRIRDDGLEELVVGGPGQFFHCWKVLRQIATAPSLAISLSSRALSSAEVKPHHAGEAYSNEATVVAIIEPTENAGILLRVFNNFSSGI